MLTDIELLQARAAIYSFVSALFSYPQTERFALLFDGDYRARIRSACETLDADHKLGTEGLVDAADHIFRSLPEDPEATEKAFIEVFGHTLSKNTAPYELEHLQTKEVYHLTQELADINGFYRAFGLEIDTKERADHIAVQAEFLAYLIMKEVHASNMTDGEENMTISREAQRHFWRDHFGRWVKGFCQTLSEQANVQPYQAATDFLGRFIGLEEACLELEPVGPA